MKPSSALSLAVILLGLALAPALGAATIVWSGAGDGTTWSQGTNWVGGVAPTAADEASFDGTSATAPTTVTGLTNTLQRITVNSGASANLNLTLVLTDNVTLVGTGGASLFLGAGDAVTFQSDSATVRIIEVQADIDSSGGAGTSYTFADTITLNTATNTVSLVVRDQSSLNVQGLLDVDTDTNLQVNNTTGTSVVNLNDIDLGGYLMPDDTGGSPVVTVAGDIVYSADASAWDDDNVSGIFTANLNGSLVDFNNHENLEFDFDQSRVVVGGTLVLQDVATITTWTAPPRFDYLTISAAASLTFPDGLPTSPAIFVNNDLVVNGTLNFGDNDFVTYGTVVTVGAGGSLAASATPGTFVVQGNVLFTGTFSMPLDFYCWQDSLVALSSDVTFARNVTVNNCDFGADEDGATTTNMATLRFNGNFVVTATGRLDVGEGNHYFAGDIDLSAADDRVIGPATPNTDPTVHLTGAAQAIDFSAGGSYFIVTSVAATTSVTQTGLMILAGDLNLSGSTQATVWTAATGALIEVGDGSFPVEGTLTMGNADMDIGAFTVWQVNNGNVNEASDYTISRAAGATGVINMVGNLRVDGDTIENSAGPGVKEEYNAARLTIDGAEIILDPTMVAPLLEVQVTDGGNDGFQYGPPPLPSAVMPVDFEGNGGSLELINGAALSAALIKVGYAESNPVTGQPAPPLSEHSGSHLSTDGASLTLNVPGTGNGLTTGHYAALDLINAAVSGEAAYKIESVPETFRVAFLDSSVTTGSGSGPQRVKVFLGGLNLYAVDTTFDKLDSSGFWVRPNGVVKAFNGNTFTNNAAAPSGPPAHITLQTLGAGSAAYWDNNHFDNSVSTGTGGLLVNIMSAGAPVQFRVPAGTPNGFGVVGFAVTAAQAETFDNDGATVGVDVTWNDAANQVTVTDESAGLPAGLVTDSGVSHQTVLLFGLSAAPGNVVVNGVILEVDAYGASLDDADVASFTLFEDANLNGAYDTGEEFAAATLNAAYAGGGTMTFDLAGAGVPQLIVAGTPQHWGVSVRFAASGNGYAGGLSVNLLPGGITSTDIVAGLPLLVDHIVTGPASQLAIITQPGGAAAGAALVPQPVIELRDALGNRVLGDSSTTVTASILTDPVGGSVLGGTLAVAAVEGQVTFTNLSINQAGNGFVLRFTAGAATVDSTAFNISAAPAGGGDDDDDGGCSTGGNGNTWLLMLGVLALGALALRIRGSARRS
jgi:hypothetical protein